MPTIGPGEDGDFIPGGAQRWEVEQEEIDHMAEQDRLVHEAERSHTEEAADEGTPVPAKRPWWRFRGPR
jgi:hypothetical protein